MLTQAWATKPHRTGRLSLRRGQGKNFGNYDELSWQLPRTIVAVGTNYRGNWHELSWQLARTIVAIGANYRGSYHETQMSPFASNNIHVIYASSHLKPHGKYPLRHFFTKIIRQSIQSMPLTAQIPAVAQLCNDQRSRTHYHNTPLQTYRQC